MTKDEEVGGIEGDVEFSDVFFDPNNPKYRCLCHQCHSTVISKPYYQLYHFVDWSTNNCDVSVHDCAFGDLEPSLEHSFCQPAFWKQQCCGVSMMSSRHLVFFQLLCVSNIYRDCNLL